jgi:cation diffusion facilitator CzcD-associated flavoprotein CzcO
VRSLPVFGIAVSTRTVSAEGLAAEALRPVPAHVRIAIVGSGFSGLGMAIRLKQEGQHDFVVLERAAELGGTWRDNSYPDCGCDVASHLYSFSFAPNPEWSRSYARQPEIFEYLGAVTDRYAVRPHICFSAELLDAAWDESALVWRIRTARGELTANVLIAGMGPLSDPAIPELPGRSSFAGPAFHSASWRHDVDLTGKRVGVIGTGASAIQFVPKIAPDLAALTVFQRTAPWVLPRGNKPISAARQRAYRRVPRLQQLVRGLLYGTAETLVLGLTGRAKILSLLEKQGRSLLERQVPDPELRATLTPTFAIGCKRILFSTTWYPALSAENATVVPDRIEEVVPEGVRTGDGTLHKLDVLIFGTGFHVTDMAVGERVRGRGGVRLDEAWNGSPQAYLGTTVSGFPNMFLLVGPNTGLGHTSIIYMIESQLPYVEGALDYLAATGAGALEVRREVQDAYNADLQRRMDGTVWTSGGCNSWYLDENGRNSTLWPDFTFRFRTRLRKFDPEGYAVSRVDAGAAQLKD